MNDDKRISGGEELHKHKEVADDSKDEFLERWKDSEENRMGNDIASEIKIANSEGEREGGNDKRWHIEAEE